MGGGGFGPAYMRVRKAKSACQEHGVAGRFQFGELGTVEPASPDASIHTSESQSQFQPVLSRGLSDRYLVLSTDLELAL